MTTKLVSVLAAFAALTTVGCQQNDEPEFSYFDERIAPTLNGSCARGPAGGACHVPVVDGIALGNLDLSSYDSLMRRDDLLVAYGPYTVPTLLLKAGEQVDLQIETFDPDNRFIPIRTDVRHVAGNNLTRGSQAYSQLKQWLEAGYERSGVPDETLVVNEGDCSPLAGDHALYDSGFADRFPEAFAAFRNNVQPVLRETCSGSQCHAARIADLYLACGDNDEQLRWNFWISVQHVTTPASTSGLLRRPLSSYRGGVFHEGGNVFGSAEDPNYVVIREWADDLVENYPDAVAPPTGISEGFRFFANRVQPVLVRKGCMLMNCHSPSMFHDLRLQGGAGGHFSRVATWRNYDSSRLLLAMDATDPNESRIIAKNLFPAGDLTGGEGIRHRGAALFEDFDGRPATPAECVGVDADNGDLNEIPAYCVFVRWHEIERSEEATVTANPLSGIVWVSRPLGVGHPHDFDTYRPGADLLFAATSEDVAADALTPLGAGTSLLTNCAGLDATNADVRGPSLNWDGNEIAFSARNSAAEPLRLWRVSVDGSTCSRIDEANSSMAEGNGIPIHDFDPAWTPHGDLAFASTRGNLDPDIIGIGGPTLTPAALEPNANMYLWEAGGVRQLTYLLNQEIQPNMLTDGRLIFTSEKRSNDFHQLAGRRINLDGGDYHPLFAQRDSVGYASATEFAELLDRNLVLVGGPLNAADGAGQIVVVNRSIGPDQTDRDPEDTYYLSSQSFPMNNGVFRSPAGLPNGHILVACDMGSSDPTAGNFDFDLCEMNPDSGVVNQIGGIAGRADIEAIPIFARAFREEFVSRIDEANGSTHVVPGETDATVEVVDFPLLATLVFSNTRIGRPINLDMTGFDVLAEYPPMPGDSFNTSDRFGDFFLRREELGNVPLNPDGSAYFRYRGGLPIVLRPTGPDGPFTFGEGEPFTGEVYQRETMQFYPGERSHQSFRRVLFNGMCGGCHGSISGRELDVAVDYDVLSTASQADSNNQSPQDIGPGL